MSSVLFVCLGNICRSPLAEGVLRTMAAQRRMPLRIDSAGTSDWHAGRPPDTRSQAVGLRHGIDISDLRARQVAREDFSHFEHIVAMDDQNMCDLSALQPAGSKACLSRLLDHVDLGIRDVPDPYYGDAVAFEECFRLIHAGVQAFLSGLQHRG